MTKEWDVFISHASEDKDTFVRPLAEALSQLGVKVWYDEFTLKPGQSLSSSIDRGLAGSRFGLVVISESFIGKEWTERELQGLVAGKMERETTILPIWLGVSRKTVYQFSPPLADTIAIVATGLTAEQVVLSVLKSVRPDIYESYPRSDLERKMRGRALEDLQMELNKIKDELKELISTEIRNVVKLMCSRVSNPPIPLEAGRFAMTPEGMKQREETLKVARQFSNVILEAAEDYLRESQARVVQKVDPERAERIRRLKPTF
ncbi:MAG: toll/interleukin-1 receptor domain-containing protein [Acidobacteriota bacterium]